MQEVPDQSVHLIITSPPYWQIKDYDRFNQIGFNETYEEYVNSLNLVWYECRRILHDGCRMAINIGDQFARSLHYGRYKVIPIRTEIMKFCETAGFDHMGSIIWQKVTTCNPTGGASIMGSYPYPRNGIIKIDYEFILIFKKPGNPPQVDPEAKRASRLSSEEWKEYFAGHWNFPGEKQGQHPAAFPEEVPRRLIKMFSFVDETVLDPFIGSGTTALAAKNLNRNSIGYEINESFLPIIREKVKIGQRELFTTDSLEVVKPERERIDWIRETDRLPYLFQDQGRFETKIGLQKGKSGPKLNEKKNHEKEYLKPKRVIAPNLMELEDKLIVRLLGIGIRKGGESEAMTWLWEKVKRDKVFLKFDKRKYDDHGHLLAYVYLKNRTFINLHLLRSNLVDLDKTYPFRYHEKFERTLKESQENDETGNERNTQPDPLPLG
ncbi:MAG: DNA methyltransferase [Thermodesulfobacteriota bacterium]